MKKSRADFLYRLGAVEDLKVLLIWDLDQGHRSVTNDIENVVADIAIQQDIDPVDYCIFYRGTDHKWFGWDPGSEDFFPLGRHMRTVIAQGLPFNFNAPTTA